MLSRSSMIEAINRIPPLSESTHELMRKLVEPAHSMADIVAIVDKDPMLTMQVLKIANCAALARRVAVSSVEDAVAYLGDKTVAGIALSLCVGDLFDSDLPGYLCKRGMLWRHSLLTAIAARELAKFSEDTVASGTAYTAGLLHDIGKAILAASLHAEGGRAGSFSGLSEHGDFLAVERATLGVDHADTGGLLCVRWRVPQVLVQAVRYHHRPADAQPGYRTLCYLVHLADHAAMSIGSGTGIDAMFYRLDPAYAQVVSLDHSLLERILFTAQMEMEQTLAAFNEVAMAEETES